MLATVRKVTLGIPGIVRQNPLLLVLVLKGYDENARDTKVDSWAIDVIPSGRDVPSVSREPAVALEGSGVITQQAQPWRAKILYLILLPL